jgi:hypothetical protein
MHRRILAIVVLLLCSPFPCRAGGPQFVAGSGFDADVQGESLTWANARVQYFTDQGDLSPILSGSQADSFVANAFTPWTSTAGVSLTATLAGHLAEDVSGANVVGYPDGTYTIPTDIQPSALATPVGIVYDYDGQVTDALLGIGAGDVGLCFTNAVYGGPDNFSTDGHLAHALVVINGVCAASNSQLPDVRYRLVRALGRVLGLGWSQANLNVITRYPAPGTDDFEGFPLMHFMDSVSCVPIAICYPDADVPKLDDRAALRRLYTATPKNPEGQQPQARIARIHGSVYFTDASGNQAQPMQGVNIVARMLDVSGQPSRRYVATSVSGFAFHGNAGNPVIGFADFHGQRYDYFGSDDPTLEGAFDLAGLEIPDGFDSARFQLTVEALDANWSEGVGPYAPAQVAPSGTFTPVVVTLHRGDDVAQDILMQQSTVAGTHPGSKGTYADPADMPQGGGWGAWISGYGDGDWFHFAARAHRTASITATAVDEQGRATQSKVMPVIGIWQLSDQSGDPAPAATPSAFNTLNSGMTRLDAQFNADTDFRVGIVDARGDGRPDYFYVASLLYSDTVTPSRTSLAGTVVSLDGIGFHTGLQISAGGVNSTVLSASANELLVALPPALLDGTASLVVTDPASGGFSQMIDALTYGASASDLLILLQGAEPATPIGSEAANAIRVQVVAADGITPVSGATVAWSITNGGSLSACGGLSGCSVLSDESGVSSTRVTPAVTGASTITALLAPASYSPPQSKQATIVGTSSALDIGAVVPTKWIGQGATLDVPLMVRVLNQGVPQASVVVNFNVARGSATLSAGNATTDNSGYASISAHVVNHSGDVQVTACVAPNNNPCQIFTMFATPVSLWTLQAVSGSAQVVPQGQPFQPLVLRVTDGSSPANPVMGVNVVLDTTFARIAADPEPRGDGDSDGRGAGMPVVLGTSESLLVSAQDGLVSLLQEMADMDGACDVFITAAVSGSKMQFHMQVLAPMGGVGQQSKRAPARTRPPLRPHAMMNRW